MSVSLFSPIHSPNLKARLEFLFNKQSVYVRLLLSVFARSAYQKIVRFFALMNRDKGRERQTERETIEYGSA